jgi:hypothetical protein
MRLLLKAEGQKFIHGKFSTRSWHSKYGISLMVVTLVWGLLLKSPHSSLIPNPTYLFFLLYWLKHYPTWDDFTECPIWQPTLYEWEYYSPKMKTHTLKYELAISMKDHKIVWINGPYKGSVHDSTIVREKFLAILEDNETALTDKGYIGVPQMACPFKPCMTEQHKAFNLKHYSIRQSVERANSRVKQFACLKRPWRMRGSKAFSYHKMAFYVCSYLTQLQFIEKPLTRKAGRRRRRR